MIINHYNLRDAIESYATHLQEKTPNTQYVLSRCALIRKNSTWELSAGVELPLGEIREALFPPPSRYTVKIAELNTQSLTISNEKFDLQDVFQAINLVDKHLIKLKFLTAKLYYLLNRSNSSDSIWQMMYSCEQSEGKYMPIDVIVNVGSNNIRMIDIE